MLPLLLYTGFSADHSRYKICSQSPFCTRDMNIDSSLWSIDPNKNNVNGNLFTTQIIDAKYKQQLLLSIQFLECGSTRVRVSPINQESFQRYDLSKEPTAFDQNELSQLLKFEYQAEKEQTVLKSQNVTLTLTYSPFKIVITDLNGAQTTLNPTDTGVFETQRDKNAYPDLFAETSFGGHTDTFKNGPTSVSMDILFSTPNIRVSGLPSHTFPLSIPSTSEPIRFFNTDINRFELNSPMSMYGSIPFVLAHGTHLPSSAAVYWANPSETWANVTNIDANNTDIRFASEGGYLDVFIMMGTPSSISNSFTRLTGRPQLPPIWSLGFHQCRWGYLTQDELMDVDSKLDGIHIPHDVMWLDLDHTDDKKYFTWNPSNFKEPSKMLQTLAANSRQLVTLCDPHLKANRNYYVYKEASDSQLLIKNKDGGEFNGNCWPGSSAWVDFFNSKARTWWEALFSYDKYKNSASNLYTWNDMNEIAVFDSCDLTAPRDLLHNTDQGVVEEREVHNMYGLLMVSATFGGQLKRQISKSNTNGKLLRPFILTRSFFGGFQKYSMVWPGDNTADYGHLANSLQLAMSYGISSAVFSGSDVGGFFDSPNPELLTKWYVCGAWVYPFFRCHCHHLSDHREIYTLPSKEQELAREAVQMRYRLLPLWYTLAREANMTGQPLVRPLWYSLVDDDEEVLRYIDNDSEVMLGNSLLISPCVTEGSSNHEVIIPQRNQRWYNFGPLSQYLTFNSNSKDNNNDNCSNDDKSSCIEKPNDINVKDYGLFEEVDVSTGTVVFPYNDGRPVVLLKGGEMVPLRTRVRKAALLMKNDPYTLIFAVDKDGKAQGKLYVDDGESFDFGKGEKISKQFLFDNAHLEATDYEPVSNALTDENLKRLYIEQIKIVGLTNMPKSVLNRSNNQELEIEIQNNVLVLHRVNLKVYQNWILDFNY